MYDTSSDIWFWYVFGHMFHVCVLARAGKGSLLGRNFWQILSFYHTIAPICSFRSMKTSVGWRTWVFFCFLGSHWHDWGFEAILDSIQLGHGQTMASHINIDRRPWTCAKRTEILSLRELLPKQTLFCCLSYVRLYDSTSHFCWATDYLYTHLTFFFGGDHEIHYMYAILHWFYLFQFSTQVIGLVFPMSFICFRYQWPSICIVGWCHLHTVACTVRPESKSQELPCVTIAIISILWAMAIYRV